MIKKCSLTWIVLVIGSLFLFNCDPVDEISSIELNIDKDCLNPIQNPGDKAEIEIFGVTKSGKKNIIPLDKVVFSVRTINASGNVDVIKLNKATVIPLDGGIAEINAVYSEKGKTFLSKKRVVVTPFYRDYHQTLVLKLFMAYEGEPVKKDTSDVIFKQKDPSRICTFEEALKVVKKVDNLTRGIPKIIYLVGWQRGGHDHLYPDWSIVNPKLKREQDSTALESLRWLIREARNYNTTISLHINMVDAFEESPLWNEYVKNGIISRDEKGNLLSTWEAVKGHKAYHISYTKEWECGFTKNRIDNLIKMIPELVDGHTIHVDVFIAYWQPENRELSPYLASLEGIDRYKEVETQRKIFKYWREKGFDVTGEGIFWAHPEGEGFVGLQPMSWWYPNDIKFQMEIPECLSARGRTHRGEQGDFRFGSSMQGEEIFLKDKERLPGFLDQFCTMTLPWYYLSRLKRVAFIDETLYYSEGIIAREENGHKIIRKGNFILRDNDNLFVPALWRDKEIIAYSKDGYSQRYWIIPEDWVSVKEVDIYTITIDGIQMKKKSVPIQDGKLALSLEKGEAVSIIPAKNNFN